MLGELNSNSLCAKCEHLITKSYTWGCFRECFHRPKLNRVYDSVCIDKGFTRCRAFKLKSKQQYGTLDKNKRLHHYLPWTI